MVATKKCMWRIKPFPSPVSAGMGILYPLPPPSVHGTGWKRSCFKLVLAIETQWYLVYIFFCFYDSFDDAMMFFDMLVGTLSRWLRKSLYLWCLLYRVVIGGQHILVEWQFIDETTGLPGWISLCTLGGSLRVGVFGVCDFKPSAISSGKLWFALNIPMVSLIVWRADTWSHVLAFCCIVCYLIVCKRLWCNPLD